MVRRTSLALAAVLAATLTLAASAQAAQSVFRCNVNGRVLYSDEPCSNQPREVVVDDARSTAQRKEAQDSARREAALAKHMRKDRLADERAARAAPRGPAGIRSSSAPASVEYSNASGKVTKTVKPTATKNKRADIDESMPIYIDVPKSKDQPATIKR